MRVSLFLSFVFILIACGDSPSAIPKPRAYPKVVYPERKYVDFNEGYCPFTFKYPDYFKVEQQTSLKGQAPSNDCWFDLVATTFNARIHCSYHPITEKIPYDILIKDAFTIANKINQRSNYMDEIRVGNAMGVEGLIMEFKGPAASPMHFYLSDSTHHFLKASLYYNTKALPDSLQPITEFIKNDIAEIINSFNWK